MTISYGDIPYNFNVIIEIGRATGGIKYEYDKDAKMLFVDRFLPTSMVYPCNYGFIPGTMGGDGDPVDVLLHSSCDIYPGTAIKARAIGALLTEDESGEDVKILALPSKKVDIMLSHVNSYTELSATFIAQIEHFFKHYKDLEAGKFVNVKGWISAEEAAAIIMSSVQK